MVRAAWHELPAKVRRRVHLCSLPMDDIEENAAIVNALQRHATVVVQKSLAEGFGLTVAEAMWKQRPVVASRIGGIRDQIEDGRSGRLLAEPRDLEQAGAAISELLANGDVRASHSESRRSFASASSSSAPPTSGATSRSSTGLRRSAAASGTHGAT